jgi:hypothetical protein
MVEQAVLVEQLRQAALLAVWHDVAGHVLRRKHL